MEEKSQCKDTSQKQEEHSVQNTVQSEEHPENKIQSEGKLR